MSTDVTIHVASEGFFVVKNNKLTFSVWPRDASRFKIKRIDAKWGEQYGYDEKDKLVIITQTSETGLEVDDLVATVDTLSDPKHWNIVFEPPKYTAGSSCPVNASVFKLTRNDVNNSRTGYIWHRNTWQNCKPPNEFKQERALRLGGTLTKQMSFSIEKYNPVIIHIKKVGEGAGFFITDEFF
jgi:hypothetical protein